MASIGELNLAQLGTIARNINDNDRLIMGRGEVIRGKNYSGRLSALLLNAPQSNKKIWENLKQALTSAYKSEIASKVIPESTDMAKPLTAGRARQILCSARNLQIQKELDGERHTIAVEKGRIFEIENDLKPLPELPKLKSELADVEKDLAKTLEEMETCQRTGGDSANDADLADRAINLSKRRDLLTSQISRREGLEAQLSQLGKRGVLSLKERVVLCKNEMLNQRGRLDSDPDFVKSVMKTGAFWSEMATEFSNKADALYESGDIKGLEKLAAGYKEAFDQVSAFLNKEITPNRVKSGSQTGPLTWMSYAQQLMGFKNLAERVLATTTPCLLQERNDGDRVKYLDKLGMEIRELKEQLHGRPEGGDPRKSLGRQMVAYLDIQMNIAGKAGQKEHLELIKFHIEQNRFEQARLELSDYMDRFENHSLSTQYTHLVKLCMLQKANPDFFAMEQDDVDVDILALEAGKLHSEIAGKLGNMTPEHAHALLGQVTRARDGIELLAKKEGLKISDTFSFAQFSPENRDKAMRLHEIEKENMRLLNAKADEAAPREKILGTAEVSGMGERIDRLENLALEKVETYFGRLSPKNLGASAKGLEGEQLVHQLAYKFDQDLKSNPGLRVAFGLAFRPEDGHAVKRDGFLERWAGKLGGKNHRALLEERLKGAVLKHVPGMDNIDLAHILGRGGGGSVFAGKFKEANTGGADQGKHRNIIVKGIVAEDILGDEKEGLISEALLQSEFHDNPNIPRITGMFIRDSGAYMIVMERVEGSDLNKLFESETLKKASGDDRAKVALHSFAGTVNALADLHERGIIHADLKPENIMMDQKTMDARLIDFGVSSNSEKLDIGLGTFLYWSPEYAANEDVTAASDIYGLGTVLYKLTAGKVTAELGGEKNITLNKVRAFLLQGKNLGDFSEPCWNDPKIKPLKDLIQACWARSASERPTAAQMLQAIKGKTISPAEAGRPGLKEGNLGVLDVFRPDHHLRQGAPDLLAGLLNR